MRPWTPPKSSTMTRPQASSTSYTQSPTIIISLPFISKWCQKILIGDEFFSHPAPIKARHDKSTSRIQNSTVYPHIIYSVGFQVANASAAVPLPSTVFAVVQESIVRVVGTQASHAHHLVVFFLLKKTTKHRRGLVFQNGAGNRELRRVLHPAPEGC